MSEEKNPEIVENQEPTMDEIQQYIEEENKKIELEKKRIYDLAKESITKIKKDTGLGKVGYVSIVLPSSETKDDKFLYFKIYGLSNVIEYKEKIAPIIQNIEDSTRYSDYVGKDIFELCVDLITETYIQHDLNIPMDDIPIGSYEGIATRIANANGYGAIRHTSII